MSFNSNLILKFTGGASLAAALALGGLSGCAQEGMYCTTAFGAFAVKLERVSGTGACSEREGGVFGVSTYNYPGSEGTPDLNHASMAIQDEFLGLMVEETEARLGETPDTGNPAYAKGDFSAGAPDGNDICAVPTLANAQKSIPTLPAVPDDPETVDEDESLPEVPATSLTYEWSNLQFVVTEGAPGTTFTGNLKFTQDGCTAEYTAMGLFPAVGCEADIDCAAEADPDAGRPLGSGINPDFNVTCDTVLGLCMLTERPKTN